MVFRLSQRFFLGTFNVFHPVLSYINEVTFKNAQEKDIKLFSAKKKPHDQFTTTRYQLQKKKYSTFNSVKKSAVCHLQCIRRGVWFFHSISSLKKIVQLFVIDSWVRVSSYNKKRLCYLQNIVLSSKGIITHQILGVKRLKIEKPKQQSN